MIPEGKKTDLKMSQAHLIEVNKQYWQNSPNITEDSYWIYVLHTLTTAVLPCVYEDIVAKGLQEKEKMPIVSVVSGKANEFLDKLDESFGIEQRFHSSYHEFDSIAEKQKVEQLAQEISSATYGDKDKLIALTYRGIAYGDAVYDDILRRGRTGKRGEVFDCFDISRERYFVFIRNALTVIDKAYKLFEERKPSYLITTEHFFIKGLYASVASHCGAKIIFLMSGFPGIAMWIDPKDHLLQDIKTADILKKLCENRLRNNQNDYSDMRNLFVVGYGSNELERPAPLKLKQGRKNVFILPHAMCDAPRLSCRHSIYNDYNEWFLDTLRIIHEVENVNWIIKDHPLSACFNQSSYVKSVFKQYKTSNMYWYDKDYSGINIKDVADCVITCAGDAGIEYWAYGIPTVTVSEAYYCDWGVSYHMRSREEYVMTLKRITEIEKPAEKSIETAKLYLGALNNRNRPNDPFIQLFSDFYRMELRTMGFDGCYYENDSWKGSQIERIGDEFCECFIQTLNSNVLKSSAIYQLTESYNV